VSPEASASFWDMVCVALMSSDQVSINWTKIRLSRLISSESGHASLVVSRFQCVLTATLEPLLCALMIKVVIRAFWCFGRCSFWPVIQCHEVGHLVMLTSPMHQSISGLCSMSHVCPRMIVVWPMPVMWNMLVLSGWFCIGLSDMTSVMCPTLLGVLSTL